MQQANVDIRAKMARQGVKHFQVAAEMGVSYSTFSHWLQLELPERKKKEIKEAINRVWAGMADGEEAVNRRQWIARNEERKHGKA